MALVLPLLLVLALGAAEFGFAFVDWQTVSSATREGARVGSAAGDSPLADAAILNSVGEALSDVPHSQTLAAWIFKADPSGAPLDACQRGNEAVCTTTNTYKPDGFGGWTCTNGCPWLSTSRSTSTTNLDRLGVRVYFQHSWITGFLPLPTSEWADDTVMRLEPDLGGAS